MMYFKEKTQELNALSSPLAGSVLIEAAAGTGKTYNIQALFLRLLLEERIPAEKILVVTFTKSAVAELRTRISRILHEAGMAVESKIPSEDPRIRSILDRVDPVFARNQIGDALMNFDNCPIYTIHGFCQTMLDRNAFESGILFHSEMRSDCSSVICDVITNCFRRYFYAPENAALYTAFWNISLAISGRKEGKNKDKEDGPQKSFVNIVLPYVDHPELKIESSGGITPEYLFQCTEEVKKCYVPGLLGQIGNLRGTDTKKGKEELESLFLSPEIPLEKTLFTVVSLLNGKTRELPPGLFFEKCRKLSDDAELFWTNQVRLFARECSAEYDRLKKKENFMGYNDLLVRLKDKLFEPSTSLAESIAGQFRAAIVDEFQDTDPVQFGIFEKIFSRPEHVFYMVGDPRQAIYSFRGGDIFMYREATKKADCKFTLTANFRSSPQIIGAVNRIFAEHRYPFADTEILFPPVSCPAESEVKNGIAYDGVELKNPIRFLHVKEKTYKAAEVCAREIAAMLNDDKWRLPGNKPLSPSDFAVLCLTKRTGAGIQKALAAFSIPATLAKSGNIFKSDEAGELALILRSVADPLDRKSFNSALSVPSIGFDIEDACRNPEKTAWYRECFRLLNETYRKKSFVGMFEQMMELFKIPERILKQPNGERVLANFFQLRDVLHEEMQNSHLPPEGLALFLARERNNDSDDDDNELLLENDRPAVRIMTVHASKGLEFPIVYLPDMTEYTPQGMDMLYHKMGSRFKMPGRNNVGYLHPQYEALQEKLRLAYVAVTRAKYCCRIPFSDGKKRPSVLDWLFRFRSAEPNMISSENLIRELDAAFSASPLSEAIRSCVPEMVADEILESSQILCSPVPEIRDPESFRWEDPGIKRWSLLSYSSLSRSGRYSSPLDMDGSVSDDLNTEKQDVPDVFLLPGRERTGCAIHKVLEKIDFRANDEEIMSAVKYTLPQFGFDPESGKDFETVTRMLHNALSADLKLPDGHSFCLNAIPPEHRITELRFDYCFRSRFNQNDLSVILQDYLKDRFSVRGPALRKISVEQGMLTGMLDVFFYEEGRFFVLDWKTNRIGGKLTNFGQAGLQNEVCSCRYYVQYLLYSLAALKFLSMRLNCSMEDAWSRHFGGVFYLFLRGIDPAAPGRGVFYEKPSFEIFNRLDRVIG